MASPQNTYRRAPWWIYFVAASFAMLLAIALLTFWGPADIDGLQASFEDGSMRLNAVEAGSYLANAGLAAGDRVLAIDNLPLRNTRDLEIVQANADVDRPQHWQLLRGAERLELQIPPQRATLKNRLDHAFIGFSFTAMACFVLGLLMAIKRPNDAATIMGAWFIMTASVAFGLPSNWAVVWRQFPFVLQLMLWVPTISRFVIDGIFLSLFVLFPRRLFRSRWPWVALWAPVLVTLPWRIAIFDSMIHPTPNGGDVPAWISQAITLRTIVYLMSAIAIMTFSYRRLETNERRRARVLAAGTTVALAGAIFQVWYFNFVGKALPLEGVWVRQIALILLLVCPFSFYYAIIRHRAFDIQVIIRQGLQYAFARGAVLAVVPLLAAVLVLDLAFNSQQPLIEILRARGWIYVVLAGLAVLSYSRRKPWLDALDRRFFRERYDAQRVLRDTVKEIRDARSFEQVSARVVGRIEAALHSEFAALVVREPNELKFRALACAPSGHAVPEVLADSKLAALVRVLQKPLEVLADSAWLERQLPDEEIQFARQARIDLLVPVAVSPGRREALLVLGIKRSEEPYTREDQELLDAIASGLALLLETPAAATSETAQTESFRECPDCGLCYETTSATCTAEGATLISSRLPRTLTGRYRLERRRGSGGMGTVYEAMDIALERRVAVKVIREDFVNSADAAERFRRESRAAAGFSHPNVVTVHDYGVDGTRAFLVMELLNGETLRDEITRLKRLSPKRTFEIVRDVCAAVEAAHQRQLIHRDLKPENIFLARTEGKGDIVKVLDFGLAKVLAPAGEDAPTQLTMQTGAGLVVGTPAYLSPEQLLGENPTVLSDLWALAVVAYECLAGSTPFVSTPTRDWRSNIVSGNFTPIRDHVAGAPAAWQAVFQECFAVDRLRRPASVSDFLKTLEGPCLG